MNPTHSPEENLTQAGGEEMLSALFANLVLQQSHLALLSLGKAPHPETGKHQQDLDAARMFIDQLEMIAVKTKGNLSKPEEDLLKQTLTSLRLSFVEAMDMPEATSAPVPPAPGASAQSASPAASPHPPAEDAESRKKFSKKY